MADRRGVGIASRGSMGCITTFDWYGRVAGLAMVCAPWASGAPSKGPSKEAKGGRCCRRPWSSSCSKEANDGCCGGWCRTPGELKGGCGVGTSDPPSNVVAGDANGRRDGTSGNSSGGSREAKDGTLLWREEVLAWSWKLSPCPGSAGTTRPVGRGATCSSCTPSDAIRARESGVRPAGELSVGEGAKAGALLRATAGVDS